MLRARRRRVLILLRKRSCGSDGKKQNRNNNKVVKKCLWFRGLEIISCLVCRHILSLLLNDGSLFAFRVHLVQLRSTSLTFSFICVSPCAFSLLLLARVGCKQSKPSGVLIIDALVNDLNLSRSRRNKLVSLLNKTEILLTDRVSRSCVYLCFAHDDFDDDMKTICWWFWELFFLFFYFGRI